MVATLWCHRRSEGRAYTIGNDIDPICAPDWLLGLIKTRPAPLFDSIKAAKVKLDEIATARAEQGCNHSCDNIPADLLELASAVAAIPNYDEEWDEWTKMGLAIYRATESSLGRLTSAASRRSVCDRRQGELKAGAAGQVRARPQSAAVRFDDRPADRQAHPQTARFRRVEGLENVLESLRRDAWTRISHLD